MSDVAKNAIIDRASLPPVSANNTYYARFRVISEDRNRLSHWSPIYSVPGNPVEVANARVSYTTDIVSMVWEYPVSGISYDIFVGFDGSIPAYNGTSSNNTYSVINNSTTQIDVVIQIASYEKSLSPNLEVYSETILL